MVDINGLFSKIQKQTGVLQTKTGCENKVGSDLILAGPHFEYDVSQSIKCNAGTFKLLQNKTSIA